MYQCKMFYDYHIGNLEQKVNNWLESMKNTPMYDVHFHYQTTKIEGSVLITYRVEDENDA